MEKANLKVYVKTPARLHFGLIDLNGDLGRIFGGIGLGIDYPNVVLEAQPFKQTTFTGEKTELIRTLTNRFIQAYNIQANVNIHVKQTIPEHVGLGSGTQLSLAVATALAKLFHVNYSTQELAITMGRAQRTGVGTAIFEQGGFVVDGGKIINSNTRVPKFPPLIFRQPFPEDWHFVVAVPNAIKGLANCEEEASFKQSPPMPSEQVGKICRLVVMKLLPALKDQDIEEFGEALTQIQADVGDHFASVQGGRYSNATTTKGIQFLQKLDAYGVGQSSWGPAFYGLFMKEKAEQAKSKLQAFLEEDVGGKVFIAKANNKGVYVKTTG